MLSKETIQLVFTAVDNTKNAFSSMEGGLARIGVFSEKVANAIKDLFTGQTNNSGVDELSGEFDKASESIDKTEASLEELDEVVKESAENQSRLQSALETTGNAFKSAIAGVAGFVGGLASFVGGAADAAIALAPIIGVLVQLRAETIGAGTKLGVLARAFNFFVGGKLLLAAAGLTFFSAASAAFARDITIAAERTTVAADQIQLFTFQLSQLQAGANLDDLQEALLNISERFGEATRDAGAIRDALQAIGLSQEEIVALNFEGPEAQLEAIRSSFQNIATDSERIFRARELFAEDGLRTLNFLTAAQQELDELELRNISLGLTVPQETLDDLNALTKEYKVTGQLVESFSIQLGAIFSGVSQSVFRLTNNLVGLVGGVSGVVGFLDAILTPITAPLEFTIDRLNDIVVLWTNIGQIISQRVVGALRDARDATAEYLQSTRPVIALNEAYDRAETALSKVNLAARLGATNFKLLNENLPDTELQRLTQLQFDLEQALAGSNEQARILRDRLIDEGKAANEASVEFEKIIDNLAEIDQLNTEALKVSPSTLASLDETQARLDRIRDTLLDSNNITDDQFLDGDAALNQVQDGLDDRRQAELDSINSRADSIAAGFDQILAIELQASEQRKQVQELFADATGAAEVARQAELIALINQGEQDRLAALTDAASAQAEAQAQRDAAVRETAAREREAEQRQREANRNSVIALQESFDERLKIQGDYNRAIAELNELAEAPGVSLSGEERIQLEQQIGQARLQAIADIEQRQREAEERTAAERQKFAEDALESEQRVLAERSQLFDLSGFSQFDTSGVTSQNVERTAEELNRLFSEKVKAVNLSTVIPESEKSRVIQEAADLKAAVEAQLTPSFQISGFQDILGGLGDLGGAFGSLQQSGLDDRNQALRERADEIKIIQDELNAAIEAGNETEIASAQSRLDRLNAIQSREQAAAKKKFEDFKKTQKALAIVSTISAAVQVFEETKGNLFLRIAGMTAALAAGYAQVRAIDRQQFNSGSISGAGGSAGSASGAGAGTNVSPADIQSANQNGTGQQTVNQRLTLQFPARGSRDFSDDEVDAIIQTIDDKIQGGNYTSVEWLRTGT